MATIKHEVDGGITINNEGPQIYRLIGKAIGMIGAIGKDQMNVQQKFRYRGIDQVYNALNPVMAELGIFISPEVLDMKREERETKNGTVLTYTILTMKYTVYAPDGSCITMTVMGEGMDSGDKGCNKAMSVAMKYAMFQLFCIPTEEMKDPDADVYEDVLPKHATPAQVNKVDKVPAPAAPETPGAYLQRKIAEMKAMYPGFDFIGTRKALIESGTVKYVPSATMTMDQAVQLAAAVNDVYAAETPKVS